MALKLRLARGGRKDRPHYSIVVADSRKPRDGRFIEKVGTYDPLKSKTDENRVRLVQDRIQHWLDNGALPTERVAKFLGQAGITEMPQNRQSVQKAKPKAKAVERENERKEKEEARKAAEEEAKREAEEAANASAEEEAASEEAPAEDSTEAATEETPAEESSEDENKG